MRLITIVQRFDRSVVVIDKELKKWEFDSLEKAENSVKDCKVIRHIHPGKGGE